MPSRMLHVYGDVRTEHVENIAVLIHVAKALWWPDDGPEPANIGPSLYHHRLLASQRNVTVY